MFCLSFSKNNLNSQLTHIAHLCVLFKEIKKPNSKKKLSYLLILHALKSNRIQCFVFYDYKFCVVCGCCVYGFFVLRICAIARFCVVSQSVFLNFQLLKNIKRGRKYQTEFIDAASLLWIFQHRQLFYPIPFKICSNPTTYRKYRNPTKNHGKMQQ